jgi:hypothetical protein
MGYLLIVKPGTAAEKRFKSNLTTVRRVNFRQAGMQYSSELQLIDLLSAPFASILLLCSGIIAVESFLSHEYTFHAARHL